MKLVINLSKNFVLIVAAVLVAVGGGGAYGWHAAHAKPDPRQEMRAVRSKVSRLVVLPTNEEPTLATVTDPAKLKSEPFFAHSRAGDKALIYSKNKLAVLYRPSAKKIVSVGPVNVSPSGISAKKFSVAIHNGTANPAALDAMVRSVQSAYPDATIVEKINSSKTDFPTTIVAPTANDAGKYDLADEVASSVSAQRGVLPTSEGRPNADLLIVIGNDRK